MASVASALATSTATAAGVEAAKRGSKRFRVGAPRIKSPKFGGVDVMMIVATTLLGIVISWIGTGRWDKLKHAYTDLPTEAARAGSGENNPSGNTGGAPDNNPAEPAPSDGGSTSPLPFPDSTLPPGWPYDGSVPGLNP